MNLLIDLGVYAANGFLITFYLLWDQAARLAAAGCAAAIILTADRWAQSRAVYAPARYNGAHRPARRPRTAQAFTGMTLALWLAATWNMGAPVPLIGAAMWLAALLSVLSMPQQRWTLLWTTKAGLIVYAAAAAAYRLYLWQSRQIAPSELAGLFGGTTAAAGVLVQNQGAFESIGAWLLWVVLPGGYLTVLLQNWAAQPALIISPLAGARDILAALRTRASAPPVPPDETERQRRRIP